eukprot:jgi/Chlat1/2615/Chrsp178S02458
MRGGGGRGGGGRGKSLSGGFRGRGRGRGGGRGRVAKRGGQGRSSTLSGGAADGINKHKRLRKEDAGYRKDVAAGASSEEETQAIQGNAYDLLLTSLRANGGAIKRRRQDDARSEEESDHHSKQGVTHAYASPPPHPHAHSGPESEDDAAGAARTSDDVEAEADDSAAAEADEDEDDAAAENGAVAELANDERIDTATNGGLQLDANDATSHLPESDSYHAHFEHIMTEAEASALASGPPSKPTTTAVLGLEHATWLRTLKPPEVHDTVEAYGVKARLAAHWVALKAAHSHSMQPAGSKHARQPVAHSRPAGGDFASPFQQQLFSLYNSYSDVLLPLRPSTKDASAEFVSSTTEAYLLHVLNHVYKIKAIHVAQDRVIKNNARLQQQQQEGRDTSDPPRDQGFTRPHVLLLLPLRSIAHRVVTRLLKLLPGARPSNLINHERFNKEYGQEEDEAELEAGAGDQGEGLVLTRSKPWDYQDVFSGNSDDHFRLGIKITKKGAKLYSSFFQADIIVASPLGLVTQKEESEEKDAATDFLSSIEVAIVDYADVMLMQNWQHVLAVFDLLNLIPTQQHDSDFMRIREWYLNGWARHYRQTIVCSSFVTPELLALMRSCSNRAGEHRLKFEYEGVLSKIVPQVQQLFERFDCSGTDSSDIRFDYFVRQVYPRLRDSVQSGILVVIPSYFDYIRVRNFMQDQEASFEMICEYTDLPDTSRARGLFSQGRRRFLLYTERTHFYHRHRLRGIKDIVFYSLPEHSNYYAEIINLLEGGQNPTSLVLFSRFDAFALERVVGTARSKRMLKSEKSTFMFC